MMNRSRPGRHRQYLTSLISVTICSLIFVICNICSLWFCMLFICLILFHLSYMRLNWFFHTIHMIDIRRNIVETNPWTYPRLHAFYEISFIEILLKLDDLDYRSLLPAVVEWFSTTRNLRGYFSWFNLLSANLSDYRKMH